MIQLSDKEWVNKAQVIQVTKTGDTTCRVFLCNGQCVDCAQTADAVLTLIRGS